MFLSRQTNRIVNTAMETALKHTITPIGEDTDIFVLLLYWARGEGKSMHFRSHNPNADGSFEVYHINRLKEILGHDMCSQLIFMHAISGSNTTLSDLRCWEKRLLSRSLPNGTISFGLAPTHSSFRTGQHTVIRLLMV